jgi:hypothetical protein
MAARALRHIEASFRTVFGAESVVREFQNIECRIHLGSGSTSFMSVGKALTMTSNDDDSGVADVFLLSPSKYPPGALSAAGLEVGDWYLEKTLIHELSGVLLASARRRAGGWNIYTAPPWFHQGLEELLAMVLMSESTIASKTWSAYLEQSSQPGRIQFVGGRPVVADVYVGGSVLVGYLWATLGRARVLKLLSDPSESFDESMAAQQFSSVLEQSKFSAWLASSPSLPR